MCAMKQKYRTSENLLKNENSEATVAVTNVPNAKCKQEE
jgi:hypothetical protein